MTTMTDPPQASFRLSQLIYDTRYRSYTFQFIALMLLIALIAYLGANLVTNLAEQGQNIAFGFLAEPSGYDINQRAIEYDSQSSHLTGCGRRRDQHADRGVPGLSHRDHPWNDRGGAAAVAELARAQADGRVCRGVPQRAGADLDPRHLYHHDGGSAAAERVPGRGFGVEHVVRILRLYQSRRLYARADLGGGVMGRGGDLPSPRSRARSITAATPPSCFTTRASSCRWAGRRW